MPGPRKFLSFLFVLLVGLFLCNVGYCGSEHYGAGEISGPIINKVISDPILLIAIAIVVVLLISKLGNKDMTFLLTPLIALLSARTSPTTTTTLPVIPGLPPLVPTTPTTTTLPVTPPSTTPIMDYLPYLLQLLSVLKAKGDTEGADHVRKLLEKV